MILFNRKKLLLTAISTLFISIPAFAQDDNSDEPDSDVPEMCEPASIGGAYASYVDLITAQNMDPGDSEDPENEAVDPGDDSDDSGDDVANLDLSSLGDALDKLAKDERFYKDSIEPIVGTSSKRDLRNWSSLDNFKVSKKYDSLDDDQVSAIYDTENCRPLDEIFEAASVKSSKLSKEKLQDVISEIKVLKKLIDGLAVAELIDSDEQDNHIAEADQALADANKALKAVNKKSKKKNRR